MTATEAAHETWQRLDDLLRGYHALERRADYQGARREAAARPVQAMTADQGETR